MDKIKVADFLSKYMGKITDSLMIGGDHPCVTYTFKPTKDFLDFAGFKERASDPYDSFEYYIQSELVVDSNGKPSVMIGDNYESKEWEFDGDVKPLAKLISDYEASRG